MVFPLLLLQGPPIQTDGSLPPIGSASLSQDQISGCQSGGLLPLFLDLLRPSAQEGVGWAGEGSIIWKRHRRNRPPTQPRCLLLRLRGSRNSCVLRRQFSLLVCLVHYWADFLKHFCSVQVYTLKHDPLSPCLRTPPPPLPSLKIHSAPPSTHTLLTC